MKRTSTKAFDTPATTAAVTAQLTVAIQAYWAPCKDIVPLAPLTPSQVSRAAGGGGTQQRSAGTLVVLAPLTVKLAAHGTSKLSITLKAKDSGGVGLSLARGTTLLASGTGQMLPGSSGLRIALPRGAKPGTVSLRVSFATGLSEFDPGVATTLKIRLRR